MDCRECSRYEQQGGCLTHRLRRGDGLFHTRRDVTGRGEFLVTEKNGQQRYTSGWRDWRNHCKTNGLVEIDSRDSSLITNRAPKLAEDRLKAALPKAVDSAIRKVKNRPYFDKRVAGMHGTPSKTEIRKELQKSWKSVA